MGDAGRLERVLQADFIDSTIMPTGRFKESRFAPKSNGDMASLKTLRHGFGQLQGLCGLDPGSFSFGARSWRGIFH